MAIFRRGSQWRRWDLHVHTPASIVQEYGGNTPAAWDAFIQRLAALPRDISVVAISDYLFIDGYERLLARRHEIPHITTIIPNIEFRLDTFAGTANNNKRHNFHVLFDPSVPPQTIREQLLNCLSTAYTIAEKAKWNQTPTVQSLSELGAMIKSKAPAQNSIHNKTDLEAGFDNITYKREDILRHLAKDPFRGKFLTAIGYSEWDQARWDQSAAEKRTLINEAHFSLTSNDDIAAVEEHAADLRRNALNNLILHSSDSHTLGRVGQTKLWIKADPTFSGLKQVINEPERVFLGDAAPRFKQPHQVIDSISIPASADWFEGNLQIELNEGLVAIIGGRGSGKSAFAEMIATGAGISDPSADSFINKAAKHNSSIMGTDVLLTWGDGTSTLGVVGEIAFEDAGVVKYLPQKAVEELCSPENSGTLLAQIESVIFQALDDTAKLGSSDFGELKQRLLERFEFEKADQARTIDELNEFFHSLQSSIKSRPSKQRDLDTKKKELAKLNADLPQLPQEDLRAQAELADLSARKKNLEDRIVALRNTQEQIAQLQTKIRLFQTSFDNFGRELLTAAQAAGISDLAPFRIQFNAGSMNQALVQRTTELQRSIDLLRNGTKADVAQVLAEDTSSWPFSNYEELVKLIDARVKETKAFETQKVKFQQQKAKIIALDKSIAALTAEIGKITNEYVPQLEVVRRQRFDKYTEYFSVLANEQEELTKLYHPLQQSLEQGSDTDRRLKFEAKVTYALDEHLDKGLSILDRTKKGNFREIEGLRRALNDLYNAYGKGQFQPDAIRAALMTLWQEFTYLRVDSGQSIPITVESQLREGLTEKDFFAWFLDPSHFRVTSSITFDDTDLYLLSPGQKGIVLLMLYLGMDKADTRPLIIDQPEDNLDNLSVYKDLIALFRDRKRFRQIIVITHNPNLVVNTDAEQIIVANYDGKRIPRITYSAGSLENQAEQIPNVAVEQLTDGIIEHVCNVLEGGPGAFSRRSRVYALSPKIQ